MRAACQRFKQTPSLQDRLLSLNEQQPLNVPRYLVLRVAMWAIHKTVNIHTSLYTHTHIHAHIHRHIHPYIHTYIHIYIQTYIHHTHIHGYRVTEISNSYREVLGEFNLSLAADALDAMVALLPAASPWQTARVLGFTAGREAPEAPCHARKQTTCEVALGWIMSAGGHGLFSMASCLGRLHPSGGFTPIMHKSSRQENSARLQSRPWW